ncbi:methyltransferase, partial [Mycobacterium sp. ITM-2017-0098]
MILALLASAVAVACFFAPVLLVVIGVLLLLLVFARFVYRRRDRYIPNLYSRDIAVYEDDYQAFVRRTMSDLRQCR